MNLKNRILGNILPHPSGSWRKARTLPLMALGIMSIGLTQTFTAIFPQKLASDLGSPTVSRAHAGPAHAPVRKQTGQPLALANGHLPMSFEANEGQTDPQVKFLARGRGYTLYLTSNEAVLALGKSRAEAKSKGRPELGLPPSGQNSEQTVRPAQVKQTAVRMKLMGANPEAHLSREELPGKVNYFVGRDPSRWRTNLPTYARIKYSEVYPGIDLVYYGKQGQLEHDFVLAPGADPRTIKMAFEGNNDIKIDAEGNLILQIDGGELRLLKARVYQEINGTKHIVDARYVMEELFDKESGNQGKEHTRASVRVGVQVAAYDRSKPLIIDPVLIYSTYLGGSGTDEGLGIAVDSSGNAYVTGKTDSTDFPTAGGLQSTFGGGSFDAFVVKINAAGSALVYSTYLGGSGTDEGLGIAVDSSGTAYVTGQTDSTNFPTVNALQPTLSGRFFDAFIAKINPAGSSFVYSTYLGGSLNDRGLGIAVDTLGTAYVTGQTDSSNFPTSPTLGAFQPNFGGGLLDAFVAKINAAGLALVYSTYLGGNDIDVGVGIAVDTSGNAYVTGQTDSINFPTETPLQAALRGSSDSFIAKINAAGLALVYSTYLGGGGSDFGVGIAVDTSGNAYITGQTGSGNFPIFPNPGALQPTLGGVEFFDSDSFVAKINAAGSALVYSTYLGGSDTEEGHGIAVDTAGNAYITGQTGSPDFPTAGGLQSIFGGGSFDAFVAKINAAGSALDFSTYLGGGSSDFGVGIAVDSSGNAYVTGHTNSTTFPTETPLQATFGGLSDSFIAKIGPPSLTSIVVTPANPTINVGQTQQFTAKGTFSDVSTQDLTTSVTWTSNNTAVATIDQTGLATGIHSGTSTMMASSGNISGSTTLGVVMPIRLPVRHMETQTGQSHADLQVKTSSRLTAVAGDLYLAAISTKPSIPVRSVSGLGLTWTLAKAQCSGRAQTGVEVWQAGPGTPTGSEQVTATLADRPKNTVIAVSRYSGAEGINELTITSANTVGVDADCDRDRGKNIDTDSYSVGFPTSGPNSLVYGAVAIRHRRNTPGSGFIERAEVWRGSEGDIAGLAIEDRVITLPRPVAVNGTLSGDTDWSVIAVEIKAIPRTSR